MKTISTICLLIVTFVIFSSCNKEGNKSLPNSTVQQTSQGGTDESVLERISVNSKGYLVFANRLDVIAYSKLLNSPSKQIALDHIRSKGFHQTPSSLTAKDDDPYTVIFDEEGLLQVEDILLKLSADEKFLYIVKEQNLDPEVYSKLLTETYDELKMDKINVDRLNEEFDMFALVDYTPIGLNEPGTTEDKPRPMFGHTYTNAYSHLENAETGQCQFWHQCVRHQYAFWTEINTTEGQWVSDGWHDCNWINGPHDCP